MFLKKNIIIDFKKILKTFFKLCQTCNFFYKKKPFLN